MNKQTKHSILFEQAIAIAIKEGKVESSKDTDPFNSGVVGENFLLFSKQSKLLKSIPLERLKRGSNTVKDGFGLFGWSAIGIAGLAFLNFIIIPKDLKSTSDLAKSGTAANAIATIAKECAVKKAVKEIDPKFSKFELENHTITPSDLNCDGDQNNLITAQSKNTEKYPTFSYNVETDEKTCSHNGQNEELYGCSARRNGEWESP